MADIKELAVEYDWVGSTLNDLIEGKAKLYFYDLAKDMVTKNVEDVFPDYTENLIKDLKVYWIDLRKQIREKMDEDEAEMLETTAAEPGMIAEPEHAIPKNDYRRQQNSAEE